MIDIVLNPMIEPMNLMICEDLQYIAEKVHMDYFGDDEEDNEEYIVNVFCNTDGDCFVIWIDMNGHERWFEKISKTVEPSEYFDDDFTPADDYDSLGLTRGMFFN